MIKGYAKLKKLNKNKLSIPRKAQDIVEADTIYKDGIFKYGNRYSMTYRFKDINYSVASKEEKVNIFLDYSELLNSLDSSTMSKITINNRKINIKDFKSEILIPFQQDGLNEYREEYNQMLLDKVSGSEDILQEKYLTVTVFRNSYEEAKSFFNRTSLELSSHFAKLGSSCENMDAIERLKVLHDFYRSGEEEFFNFEISDSARKGHSFKDAICPKAPVFEHKCFRLGDKFGRVLYLSDYARYIKDSFVSEICSLNKNLMFSIDIVTVQTDEAVKEVENRLLGVETNISATRS